MPAIPALDIQGLSHHFGRRQALDDITFTVPVGAFTILLGQNGAGKTTLFNLITRLYSNQNGEILIFGIDIKKKPGPALGQLGMVFQQRTVDLDLTIRQNLLYHAGLHGLCRKEARARCEAELLRFDLLDRADDRLRELSGGQMRRVEIARALLHRPRLLLLDEPTVGLDIGSRQNILAHVRRLCTDEQVGVLWSTHLIDESESGDDVILLHRGRIRAAGKTGVICKDADADDLGEAFARLTGAPAT